VSQELQGHASRLKEIRRSSALRQESRDYDSTDEKLTFNTNYFEDDDDYYSYYPMDTRHQPKQVNGEKMSWNAKAPRLRGETTTRKQDTSTKQDTSIRKQDTTTRIQDTTTRKQETATRKQETTTRKQDTTTRTQDTTTRKPQGKWPMNGTGEEVGRMKRSASSQAKHRMDPVTSRPEKRPNFRKTHPKQIKGQPCPMGETLPVLGDCSSYWKCMYQQWIKMPCHKDEYYSVFDESCVSGKCPRKDEDMSKFAIDKDGKPYFRKGN